MIRKSEREFKRNICDQSKSNPKIFWSYVRSKLKTKTSVVPPLHDDKYETSTKFDDKGKANILQKQFVSVFTKKKLNGEVPILDINITEEMVWNKILKLNVNKSCRYDEMHPQILIELVDLVSKLLVLLLNTTMDEGCIPQDCKIAYISPIFKKRARNKAENYRPMFNVNCVQIDGIFC